ncbi:T9SS type A sorting domain-containing protein [Flammeovirga sp. MY04]|uniref:T9SS type A sorting domain-containing protein n=1 Tax=Flammeovirga sp. MY04 TaxID=1191459 RepID=UPI0008263BC3|nr:T9SS type A sorting domain-containing protein [Flammeovirga sp. MY04]
MSSLFGQCSTNGINNDVTFNVSGQCNEPTSTFYEEITATSKDITVIFQDGDDDPNDGIDYILNYSNSFITGVLDLTSNTFDSTYFATHSVHLIIKSNTYVKVNGHLVLRYGSTLTIEPNATLEVVGNISFPPNYNNCSDCNDATLSSAEIASARAEFEEEHQNSVEIYDHGTMIANNIDYNSDLPVELTFFKASKDVLNNDVILKWQTATEVNASHFNIQKSNNSKQWKTIGSIEANGNSNITIDYEYIDQINTTDAFYRLEQVDFDGRVEYFGPIKVVSNNIKPSFDVTFAPNPLPNNSDININVLGDIENMDLYFQLVNINGEIFFEKTFNGVSSNIFYHKIPNEILDQKGLYILIVRCGNNTLKKKLIKM